MAQFFGIEDIKLLSKASQTTIEWEAGSLLRIGGQAYTVDFVLTLDLATDIDTGSVAADTKYYIYAVNSSGVSLVYSLSGSSPVGYNAYRKIGAFKTDNASEVSGVADGETALSALSADNATTADAATQLTTATGLAPSYAIRAWVSFDGTAATPVPLGSGNVTNITDNGAANYTIHFDTPMSNTNYGVVSTSYPVLGTNGFWHGTLTVLSKTTTSVTVGNDNIGNLPLCSVFIIE
jgi:hypothetical protein